MQSYGSPSRSIGLSGPLLLPASVFLAVTEEEMQRGGLCLRKHAQREWPQLEEGRTGHTNCPLVASEPVPRFAFSIHKGLKTTNVHFVCCACDSGKQPPGVGHQQQAAEPAGKCSFCTVRMGTWREGTLNSSASANQSGLAFQRHWLLLLSQTFYALGYVLCVGEMKDGSF